MRTDQTEELKTRPGMNREKQTETHTERHALSVSLCLSLSLSALSVFLSAAENEKVYEMN